MIIDCRRKGLLAAVLVVTGLTLGAMNAVAGIIISIEPDGDDVVMTSQGFISGLTDPIGFSDRRAKIVASAPDIFVGNPASGGAGGFTRLQEFPAILIEGGPLGLGGEMFPDFGDGILFGVTTTDLGRGEGTLFVDETSIDSAGDYIATSNFMRFRNQTLADLGLTPGATAVFSIADVGASNTVTIQVVPEPAVLSLLAFVGGGLIFAKRRLIK